jgi:hypothetical protein
LKWIHRESTWLMGMIRDGYSCTLMGFITIYTMGMGDHISVLLCSAGLWMDGLTAHFSLFMVTVTVPLIMGMGMSILDIILTISLIASYVSNFPYG